MHLFSAQMTDYFIPWTHRVMTSSPILGPRIPTHSKATIGWNYPTAAAASCLLPIPQPTKKNTRQKQHTTVNLEVGWRVNLRTSPFSFGKTRRF